MDHFKYEPIDLETRSFRLVRLLKGDDEPVRCELFHAWLHDAEDVIEYEALSYTWGGMHKPYKLEINGRKLLITENLSLALQHLRRQYQDRILWVDAICINQDNHKEQGHQVRQMATIYERAEQVIFWLGPATPETDLVFLHMCQLEKQALDYACNSWRASDERWRFLWSNVQLSLKNVDGDAILRQRKGFSTLLGRSWFRRVWILQEAANARSAKVMCGTKSVSARIFAIVPPLIGMTPGSHCQAVLDIMPGPSRKHSWWTENRDLRTLLTKFRGSQASDERDNIYALLGISSDGFGTDILAPNYEKSVGEVIHDTVAFLLHFRNWKTLP
ncbi:heterokaryon incompatibility protein-domain-containing protein, partial [Paraphoma chrysanthemicola]